MLRIFLIILMMVASVCSSVLCRSEEKKDAPQVKIVDRCLQLYHEMDLEGRVNYIAFRQAVTGYYRIGQRKREVLTLIDFSKPSTQERLYVFDMKQKKCCSLRWWHMGRTVGTSMLLRSQTKTVHTKVRWGFI